MRAIMTSSQERPKLENRNSKLANCDAATFEFRISSFELKLTLLLTLALGLGAWAAARVRYGTRLGEAL